MWFNAMAPCYRLKKEADLRSDGDKSPRPFLFCSTPSVPLDLQEVESKIEGFKTFTKKMDENIAIVNTTINEFARKQATGFKKEYQKVGQSFKFLAQAFELDQQAYSAGLNRAIAGTGEAYEAIGDYFAEQPRQDLDPISDLLDFYRGHLANFPDIIHVQKGEVSHTHTYTHISPESAAVAHHKRTPEILHLKM